MVEYKVLITTSGLGSRLGTITDYTNKCLIRVSDKPAISHIIESYPIETHFVITLGHYGSYVKQFLELAYPHRKFTYINVDKYNGDGSSLGYSILQCKTILNCPFIFNASDTIVKNFKVPNLDHNWICGSNKEDSSHYRTINLNNGKLIKINEKGEIGYDFSYIGVCGIKNYELFFFNLEEIIKNEHNNTSDVHVINNMVSQVDFSHIEVPSDNWFDIGNVGELIKTRKSFKTSTEILDKRDESIFLFEDFVIKFFSSPSIIENRVKRAEKLKGIVPNIISHSENFYKYQKSLGKLFSRSVNESSFLQFLNWSQENLWIKKEVQKFSDQCYKFYIEKTNKRVSQYLEEKKEPDIINNKLIPSVNNLINELDVNWLCNGLPSQFHGDFILDNVIETDSGYTLIDWRQDFAGDLEIGDIYYDLAKLNHNLTVNHDIVSKNLFGHSSDNCFILTNSTLNECKKILNNFIIENGYDIRKVEILTSLIWLNMSALHDYPLNDFLFNWGKYTLYKNIKRYE